MHMLFIPSIPVFIFAALILNLSPGPDMIYVATRSASQGLRGGVISAAGIFSGCLVHITLAIFGLSIILQKSAMAFRMIKYGGAAYLIYLGVASIIRNKEIPGFTGVGKNIKISRLYFQSVMTNVLNPKVAVFFLAFLPQFVHPEGGNIRMQILGLGLYFDIQGTLILLLLAVLTSRLGNKLLRNPRALRPVRRISGSILIALGIRLALLNNK
ncbi:MAG TPA: LysE family translocator [Chitinophagaceae bacterium]|nr:LysE family translocator [Chitinophagaceae bacterium]